MASRSLRTVGIRKRGSGTLQMTPLGTEHRETGGPGKGAPDLETTPEGATTRKRMSGSATTPITVTDLTRHLLPLAVPTIPLIPKTPLLPWAAQAFTRSPIQFSRSIRPTFLSTIPPILRKRLLDHLLDHLPGHRGHHRGHHLLPTLLPPAASLRLPQDLLPPVVGSRQIM